MNNTELKEIVKNIAKLDFINGSVAIASQSRLFNDVTQNTDIQTNLDLSKIYLDSWHESNNSDTFVPKMVILQLPDNENNRMRKFTDLETLQSTENEIPNCDNYELVFIEPINNQKQELEGIFVRFNANEPRPSNYYGHSLSVSDIVVITNDAMEMEAYYVDTMGYKKLDGFINEKTRSRILTNNDIHKEYDLINGLIQNDIQTTSMLQRYNNLKEWYEHSFNLADKRFVLEQQNKLNTILPFKPSEEQQKVLNALYSAVVTRNKYPNDVALQTDITAKLKGYANELDNLHVPFAVQNAVSFAGENFDNWERQNNVVLNDVYQKGYAEQTFISKDSQGIAIDGHTGTWHTIDNTNIDGVDYFLLEHDEYGDEAASLIVNSSGTIVLDEVYNGFEDLIEYLDRERISLDAPTDIDLSLDALQENLMKLSDGQSKTFKINELEYQVVAKFDEVIDGDKYYTYSVSVSNGEIYDNLYFQGVHKILTNAITNEKGQDQEEPKVTGYKDFLERDSMENSPHGEEILATVKHGITQKHDYDYSVFEKLIEGNPIFQYSIDGDDRPYDEIYRDLHNNLNEVYTKEYNRIYEEFKVERSNDSVAKQEQKASNVTMEESEKGTKDLVMEQFQDGVKSVMDSDKFRDWCKTSGSLYFTNYSFRNAMLVYLQNPNSSYVMGYEAWKEFGRQVSKGSSSIKIFAPAFAKEYGAKGSFLKSIKKNLQDQLNKNPNLEYASYRLGQSKLGFNALRNGLYEVTVNGNVAHGKMTEEQLRKFIDTQVIGKVPVYFNVTSVFDVTDTAIPEFLWIKSGYKKEELALNENGDPVKSPRGEYKVINTIERQSKFVTDLDLSIPEGDEQKMQLLFDTLQEVSKNKGVPMTVEHIEDEGIKGFYNRKYNRIAINDKIPLTEKVAAAFHEMAHADMHKDIEKLQIEMGEDKIDRNMKEVQAEAVSCMTASNFGIDTTTSSFNYLAIWSKGRELKELEASLDVIYKQSKTLMKEIEKELDTKGWTLQLEPKVMEPMSQEQVEAIVKAYSVYIINSSQHNDDLLTDVTADLKSLMEKTPTEAHKDSREINIVKEQGVILKKIESKLATMNTLNESLPSAKNRIEQSYIESRLNSEFKQSSSFEDQFERLTEERVTYLKDTKAEEKETIKEQFSREPLAVIEALKKNIEDMKDLDQKDLKYIATSKFVSRKYSKDLGVNNGVFIANAMKQLEQLNQVKSKNGTVVEISYCEKWSDKPVFVPGAVVHPKLANKIVEQAEKEVRNLKKEASSRGEYYPETRCDVTVYTPTEKGFSALHTRVDIGDGEQTNLLEHMKQVCSRGKEKGMVLENFQSACNEKGKVIDKILPPVEESRELIVAKGRVTNSIDVWKSDIANERNQQEENSDKGLIKEHSDNGRGER